MFPAPSDYEKPQRIEEVLALLSQHGSDARVLAGGQSLLPLLKSRAITPKMLVDIAALTELREVTPSGDGFTVGALVTQAELSQHKDILRIFPLFGGDIGRLIDPIICKRGTFVGALAMADPAGDWPAIALVLDTSLEVRGRGASRRLPISGFFQDSFSTALSPADLITHAIFPLPESGAKMTYRKFPHPTSGYALVGVAALLEFESAGKCANCRIAVTGAGRRPVRAKAAEAVMAGERPTVERIEEAAQHGCDDVELVGDLHAGREYRSLITGALIKRALVDMLDGASRTGTAVH